MPVNGWGFERDADGRFRFDEAVIDGNELLELLNSTSPSETGSLLHDAFYAGVLGPGALARALGTAWSRSDNPVEQLPRRTWRSLFEHVGYTEGGGMVKRPSRTTPLYRGALPDLRDGLGWTTRPEVAQRYAPAQEGARLFVLDVPPGRLLAHITPDNLGANDEDEYVVDARGLWATIRTVER